MAFKLTYTDGQADDYDDSTNWAVEDGVLKMGRESGEWTVLVSPSHWATIEVGSDKHDDRKDKDRGKDKDKDEDKDEKKGKDQDSDEDDDDDGEDDDEDAEDARS